MEPKTGDDKPATGDPQQTGAEEQPKPITFAKFLETRPPSQTALISNLWEWKQTTGSPPYPTITTPDLTLHCASDHCSGLRFFRHTSGEISLYRQRNEGDGFLTYQCSNCEGSIKRFALYADVNDRGKSEGHCFKYGELPPFGPPTPSRLMKILGNEGDFFLKGRRCETQGLGVGAFAYYRRVVENQKNQIVAEIIRVSQKIGIDPDHLKELERAKNETRFSVAVELAKDAIPPALLINGHNPLTLLHSALSDGLHAQTDESCLEFANAIRILLIELAERLGQALKEEAELTAALTRLMNKPKT
jgi:hypothetical protein